MEFLAIAVDRHNSLTDEDDLEAPHAITEIAQSKG